MLHGGLMDENLGNNDIRVVANFNALSPQDQQDLINFLRSL